MCIVITARIVALIAHHLHALLVHLDVLPHAVVPLPVFRSMRMVFGFFGGKQVANLAIPVCVCRW